MADNWLDIANGEREATVVTRSEYEMYQLTLEEGLSMKEIVERLGKGNITQRCSLYSRLGTLLKDPELTKTVQEVVTKRLYNEKSDIFKKVADELTQLVREEEPVELISPFMTSSASFLTSHSFEIAVSWSTLIMACIQTYPSESIPIYWTHKEASLPDFVRQMMSTRQLDHTRSCGLSILTELLVVNSIYQIDATTLQDSDLHTIFNMMNMPEVTILEPLCYGLLPVCLEKCPQNWFNLLVSRLIELSKSEEADILVSLIHLFSKVWKKLNADQIKSVGLIVREKAKELPKSSYPKIAPIICQTIELKRILFWEDLHPTLLLEVLEVGSQQVRKLLSAQLELLPSDPESVRKAASKLSRLPPTTLDNVESWLQDKTLKRSVLLGLSEIPCVKYIQSNHQKTRVNKFFKLVLQSIIDLIDSEAIPWREQLSLITMTSNELIPNLLNQDFTRDANTLEILHFSSLQSRLLEMTSKLSPKASHLVKKAINKLVAVLIEHSLEMKFFKEAEGLLADLASSKLSKDKRNYQEILSYFTLENPMKHIKAKLEEVSKAIEPHSSFHKLHKAKTLDCSAKLKPRAIINKENQTPLTPVSLNSQYQGLKPSFRLKTKRSFSRSRKDVQAESYTVQGSISNSKNSLPQPLPKNRQSLILTSLSIASNSSLEPPLSPFPTPNLDKNPYGPPISQPLLPIPNSVSYTRHSSLTKKQPRRLSELSRLPPRPPHIPGSTSKNL